MKQDKIKRICIFCGSNLGAKQVYAEAARKVGSEMAKHGFELVYGGASVGLMGIIADAALSQGGRVIGVIPQVLVDKEIAHKNLTELHIVQSMHERKAHMTELADGFIALPGGTGTLEEIFEIWTWAQLGLHKKPLALFNVANFYDSLCSFLDHQASERFMRQAHRDMLIISPHIKVIIQKFATYQPLSVTKWISDTHT